MREAGGPSLPTQGWGCARVNLDWAAAGESHLDLAFAAADVLDAHFDWIAEAVRLTAPPACQRGTQLVQLEVVAGKAPRRQERLEDLREANEEPRPDQPRDLALEGRLPAELE